LIFQQSTKKGPADKPAFFLEEHALSAMEHPHWVMVAGTVLVVLGVIGLHLAKTPRNAQGALDAGRGKAASRFDRRG
jgi:hypothetical protein